MDDQNLDAEDQDQPAQPGEPNFVDMSEYQLRDELERLIIGELHGPCQGEQEKFRGERPQDRYLVSLLAPKFFEVGQEHDEGTGSRDGGTDSDDGDADPVVGRADSLIPSSFGITFMVDPSVDEVEIEAQWGRYRREAGVLDDDLPSPADQGDDDGEATLSREATQEQEDAQLWQREQRGGVKTISLQPGSITPIIIDEGDEFIVVEGIVRDHGNDRTVTLFLRNTEEVPKTETNKDRFWIFQAKLAIRSTTPGEAIFRRRPIVAHSESEDALAKEDQELAMRYRDTVEFAVGHGVAADWADPQADQVHQTTEVHTSVVPRYEVAKQTPPTVEDEGFEGLAGVIVDMSELATGDRAAVIASLRTLIEAYDGWIDRQRERLAQQQDGLGDYQEPGARSISGCEQARDRMTKGIEVLESDDQAWQAFQFANEAMWKQRVRSVYVKATRAARIERKLDPEAPMPSFDEIDANPKYRSWYIFQLAFVLLNIESTTDLKHPDRSDPTAAMADLLWFPTGGGKTEAYLGLAAYAMGLRRLQGDQFGRRGSAGVTVLMRYTLRLLTLQQFQRATALICAMEMIRREALSNGDQRWGKADEPFGIGLWVGAKSTPNWTSVSNQVVTSLAGTQGNPEDVRGKGSPHQLEYCPWCGTDIKPGRDIKCETVAGGRGRTYISCSSTGCDFNRGATAAAEADPGLPVIVVDEEIYRRLPSLLISTVDKFAQLPWNGMTSMLFGRVDKHCSRHGFRSPDVEDTDAHRARRPLPAAESVEVEPLRPPDLIIQDELHLISGPLGSMVGLYENTVDELCTWEVDGVRVRPKVVASTATIRNAKEQVKSIFLRRVSVFPPPGLDAGDDFFSIRREPSESNFGRRYLGICAPGRSLKAALIRAYTAYLSAAQYLYNRDEHLTKKEKNQKGTLSEVARQADPWMTLVGYFNSIRELGGMRRLVDGDVTTRLRKMDKHHLAKRTLRQNAIEELTSRKQSTDVPAILEWLEGGFSPEKEELIRKNASEGTYDPSIRRPAEVLLATSMISVGVDIDRLGAMIVGGQPKGTAEYIQATSRVGRSHPGLVMTVYNWARPRDLSHYERFRHYHATFYSHVEALSVTPYAARAIDRGLTGAWVGLTRAMEFTLNPRKSAKKLPEHRELSDEAIERLIARIENGHPRGAAAASEYRTKLLARRDAWIQKAGHQGNLVYAIGRKPDPDEFALLESASEATWTDFTCLNSLRDVEATTQLLLIDDGLGFEEDA